RPPAACFSPPSPPARGPPPRRARGFPPSRSHHDPQGVDACLRRRGGPGGLPRRGHTVAATEVVLLRVLSSGAFRGLGRAPDLSWHGEPLRRLDEADPGEATPTLGDHHPRALQ